MAVKVSPTVRYSAHQMGYKSTVTFMLHICIRYGRQDGGIPSLVVTLYIIRMCRSFSSGITPTPIDILTTACAAAITAAMPDVTAWTTAVTMAMMLMGGEGVKPRG